MQQLILALGIQFMPRPQRITSPYPPPFCSHLFLQDHGIPLIPEAETLVTTSMILDELPTAVIVDTHRKDPAHMAVSWETRIEEGIEVIENGITSAKFITRYSYMLLPWQKLAYLFAKQNSELVLTVLTEKIVYPEDETENARTEQRTWSIVNVAGYVEFTRTYIGEDKVYISRDGKTKVLVEE